MKSENSVFFCWVYNSINPVFCQLVFWFYFNILNFQSILGKEKSGWWESNPRIQLGRLVFYHWTTPASSLTRLILYHRFPQIASTFLKKPEARQLFYRALRTPGYIISIYIKRCRYPSMAMHFLSSTADFFVSAFGILSFNTPLSYFAWISSCFTSSPT